MIKLDSKIIVFVLVLATIAIPVDSVYGHGLGFDTISSIAAGDKKITLTVELPMYFTDSDEQQITITAIDDDTDENTKNVTFLIGLFHENEMILRNYFFASEGVLAINVKPTSTGEIEIMGEQDDLLGAWHGTETQPLEITGPIFESGGLYTFEIEIRTIDEPTNIIENQETHRADLSVIETAEYNQLDLEGNDVKFRIKSYFDKISNFTYDPQAKVVTFEMPFDWREKTISHIPVVHEEVHFPKDFAEYLSPSYIGTVNGVELFKSSVTIDDYTEEDERIVHFVLLTDHLRYLKNEFKKTGDKLPENMIFTLSNSNENQFPLTAYTNNEEFQIDLSWEPPEVVPGNSVNFIFTIRDGVTGEPLRLSTYDFVIIQNGQEVYRNQDEATVGGAFEKFTFSENQTGPTIIKFENIRGTDAETEFGFVVVPEFGTVALLIFVAAMIFAITTNRKFSIISKI